MAAASAQESPRNAARRAIPTGLAHQAFYRLFLAPTLLDGDVWEVCSPVPPSAVDERDAEPVCAENPVHRVGTGLEGAQESQGA